MTIARQRILPGDWEHIVEPEVTTRFQRRANAGHEPNAQLDVRHQLQQLQNQPLQIELIEVRPLQIEPVQIRMRTLVENSCIRARPRRPVGLFVWMCGNKYRHCVRQQGHG